MFFVLPAVIVIYYYWYYKRYYRRFALKIGLNVRDGFISAN
jgi:hypothetical protein